MEWIKKAVDWLIGRWNLTLRAVTTGVVSSKRRPPLWPDGMASASPPVELFFFFFFVPQLFLWGSPLLGEIFAHVTVFCFLLFFFYPTIKVVTFRLRGWCVLGVFFLPAFTRLGHERQDLLSPCDEMHVCTD